MTHEQIPVLIAVIGLTFAMAGALSGLRPNRWRP